MFAQMITQEATLLHIAYELCFQMHFIITLVQLYKYARKTAYELEVYIFMSVCVLDTAIQTCKAIMLGLLITPLLL